jgi:hypothetical protein
MESESSRHYGRQLEEMESENPQYFWRLRAVFGWMAVVVLVLEMRIAVKPSRGTK